MYKVFDECTEFDYLNNDKVISRLRSINTKNQYETDKTVKEVNEFIDKFITDDEFLTKNFERICNGKGYKFGGVFSDHTTKFIVEYFEEHGLNVFAKRIFGNYRRFYLFEPSEYECLRIWQKFILKFF